MAKKGMAALSALVLACTLAACGGGGGSNGGGTGGDGRGGDSPYEVALHGADVQEAITLVMFDMEIIGLENDGVYAEPTRITQPENPNVTVTVEVSADGSKYVITGRYVGLDTRWVYDSVIGKTETHGN